MNHSLLKYTITNTVIYLRNNNINKQARSGPAQDTILQLNSRDRLRCLLAGFLSCLLAGWISGVHTYRLGFTWSLCSLGHFAHLVTLFTWSLCSIGHLDHMVTWSLKSLGLIPQSRENGQTSIFKDFDPILNSEDKMTKTL